MSKKFSRKSNKSQSLGIAPVTHAAKQSVLGTYADNDAKVFWAAMVRIVRELV